MTDSNYPDEYLLRLLAADDRQAYTLLFERYWDKVYSTSFTLTKSAEQAQDIAQEVFLKLWQQHSEAASIRDLDGLLFIYSRNLIYNRMSRMKLEDAYQHYMRHVLNGASEEQGTGIGELKEVLEKGISLLPPQQQRAFRLSREAGMSHEEIAVEMGVSRASVNDYIVRAIAFLRKYLQTHASLFLLLCPGFLY